MILSQGLSENVIYKLLSFQGGFAGVALFFFLSGYGLMESKHRKHLGIKDFIIKRYWKVYRPILIINAITYIIFLLTGYLSYEGLTQILKAIFGIIYLDGVLWFVMVLFLCYAIFMISSQIKNSRIRSICLIGSCLLAVWFFVLLGYSDFWFLSIPMFAMGVMVSEYRLLDPVKLRMRTVATGILILISILMGTVLMKTGFLNLAINTAFICMLIWLLSYFTITLQKDTFLGKISYEIYLTHNKVLILFGIIPVWLFLPLILVIGGITHYICNPPLKFGKTCS